MPQKTLPFLTLNLAALMLLFAASLSIGVADFSWSKLLHFSDDMQLMLTSRLPRTFAIVLTGASLAVAGMIMQILMRNRFVEPSMVGASQSAALGCVCHGPCRAFFGERGANCARHGRLWACEGLHLNARVSPSCCWARRSSSRKSLHLAKRKIFRCLLALFYQVV